MSTNSRRIWNDTRLPRSLRCPDEGELPPNWVGVQVQELQRRGYIDETVYATQNFSSCEDGEE